MLLGVLVIFVMLVRCIRSGHAKPVKALAFAAVP